MVNLKIVGRHGTYQLSNGISLIISTLHQTLFQACHGLEELLKNTMLTPFPWNRHAE
jgi:hypothetical protein